jgi:osmotically-inducible protein OsmY
MVDKSEITRRVHAALEREPRVNLHRYPIAIGYADEAVVLEGEVESIAAKKLALELAGAVKGPRGVLDRLRVVPGERKGDGAIADSFCAFLTGAAEFTDCTLRVRADGGLETVRDAPLPGGEIEVAIRDGVITLEGHVPSLAHKRVAGVLAWWSPGCRDVVNSLEIVPAELDSDAEVVDAMMLVLEIDPLVQAEQITASCRNFEVTLEGYVRTEAERRQAELDAWALFAVDNVVNNIELRR